MRPLAFIASAWVMGSACAEIPDRRFYVGVDAAGLDAHAGRDYGIIVGTPDFVTSVFPDSARVSGTDVSWGAQLGYRFNRYLAVELAYTDFGSMLVTETYDLSWLFEEPFIYDREVEYEGSGPSLSWIGQIPLGNDFEAFVRVGVLLAEQEVLDRSLVTVPGYRGRSTSSESMPIYGAGAAYHLHQNWSVRAELQYVDDLHGGASQDWIDNVGPLRIRRYGLAVAYRF